MHRSSDHKPGFSVLESLQNCRPIFFGVLIVPLLVLCQCSRNPASTAAMSSLPCNLEYNDVPVQEALANLRSNPTKDILFAASSSLADEGSMRDAAFRAYHDFYVRKKSDLTSLLGPPVFDGNWTQDTYPVWATGMEITVWGTGDEAIYLRFDEEDEDTGIEVSLLTPRSPTSNHEPESPYKGLRETARAHQKK